MPLLSPRRSKDFKIASMLGPLITPTQCHPAFTFSRASTASYVRSTDGLFIESASGSPRFDPTDGLLLEGARTNIVVNPRTPFGTGWTNTGVASASAVMGPDLLVSSATRVTEDTATSAHSAQGSSVSFTTSLSYATAAIVKAGTCSFVQLAFATGSHGTAWGNFDISTGVVGSSSGLTRHYIRSLGNGWWWIEIAAASTATVSAASSILSLLSSASGARLESYTGTSRTVDVFVCWTVQANFATTPPLPVTTGSFARVADTVSANLSALNISKYGLTICGRARIMQNSPNTVEQVLLQVDDNTDTIRYALVNRITAPGNLIRTRVNATAGSALFTMTAETAFNFALSIDLVSGIITVSVNGGAAVSHSGGSSAITKIRFGSSASGSNNLNGYIFSAEYFYYPVSATLLPGLSA